MPSASVSSPVQQQDHQQQQQQQLEMEEDGDNGGGLIYSQGHLEGGGVMNHSGYGDQMGEPLGGDENSTTSSNEGSLMVERRKDHEFIPTRMKTINASKPAANPQQFTRVSSNPLLVSAQKQMLQAEEIRKAKEIVKEKKVGDDEPDWQSELSSWKNRRRKQSEETLMRVAEIKVMEEGATDPNERKISLGKKLSGLLHADDDDWSDLGLEKRPQQEHRTSPTNQPSRRSPSKSPIATSVIREEGGEPDGCEDDAGRPGHDPAAAAHDNSAKGGHSQYEDNDDEQGVPLERWTSTSSLSSQREPQVGVGGGGGTRRKSSEMSSSMRSRLEAFETGGNTSPRSVKEEEDEELKRRQQQRLSEAGDPEGKFKEKLAQFQRISSRGELEEAGAAPDRPPKGAPPPPLSYSKLINPQSLQESNGRAGEVDDDQNKDLDDALEESYRSVLEENSPSPNKAANNAAAANRDAAKEFFAQETKSPSPKTDNLVDDEIDRQEREIIASLEMEEREHRKYIERRASSNTPAVPQPGGGGSGSNSQEYHRSTTHSQSSNSSYHSREPVYSHSQKQKSPLRQQQQQPVATGIPVPKKKDSSNKNYNQHWLVQEAEQRRLADMSSSTSSRTPLGSASSTGSGGGGVAFQQGHYENGAQYRQQPQQQPIYSNENFAPPSSRGRRPQQAAPLPQNQYGGGYNEGLYANMSNGPPPPIHSTHYPAASAADPSSGPDLPPRHPTQSAEQAAHGQHSQDRMLSVSGKKKCSHCKEELGRGAAMIIESLRLFYHLRCFQCCVCHVQLGSGNKGTDVRVRNNRLHCHNCYSNDEGLKFSKV